MRICAATVTLILAFMGSAMAAGLYVSTNGNDTWSGRLAAPNAERTDGPFATVARARDAVRQMKAGDPLGAPVQVVIRGGTYLLNEPFQLGPADSGTAEFPITYAAYPGEKPILSGGRRLTGWRPYRDRIWLCSLKDLGLQGLRPRQLFYRGERQVIARWPNRDPKRPRTGGFLYTEEQRTDAQIRFKAGAFPRRWSRPTEVEVVIFPNYAWGNPSVPIAKLDPEQRLITLSRKVGEIWRGDRFYVQNALEELDAPGEWHLDRQAETVYFRPPDDGLPTEGAVVPALQNLVVLQGDFAKQRFVERVNISH
ncbi:MAG: hypothetical protein NTV79_02555, partial [Candidatus Aureabacteria bacterium]|nr:hypothetical protein [Candidatus Auribacterota bacterium]